MRPLKITKRQTALALAKIAGYHNDAKAFTRLIIESRVNRAAMNMAWSLGASAKANGITCTCIDCSA